MTNDDFDNLAADERIRALVDAHYNPPRGTVPRDAMWTAVRDARRAERAGVLPIAAARRTPLRVIRAVPHWRWGAAIAAGLLIGIAIDRAVVGGAPSDRPAVAVAARQPSAPGADTMPRVAAVVASDPAGMRDHDTLPSGATEAPVASAPSPAPRGAGVPAPRRQLASGGERGSASSTMPEARDLYRAAAMQTLVQAEVLLTSYRRAVPTQQDQEQMRLTAQWSREVLSSTRLLLDSPAGREPQLRQLLTDLELVLAQIVQLSGAPLRQGERELIERAMRDRDLIPRLRSAVPAGALTT